MSTPWSVFQDGPNGEPTGDTESTQCGGTPNGARFSPRSQQRRLHGHNNNPGFGRRRNPRRSTPRVDWRAGSSPFRIRPRRIAAPIRFPPDNFKHSLTLFSKSFSSFPRGTCSLSDSRRYLTLDGIYRRLGCIPKQPDSMTTPRGATGPSTTGLSPSLAPLSGGLEPGPSARMLLQTTIQTTSPFDFHALALPGSLAVTKGILVSFFSSAY
ncbi:hypothetical protein Syun_006769 [Stephania yunnanensis]|uniref:Uncharacterized protein n=1 Tax=Stephania yunnanensis TaxID=152371 RepID=A0AAP0KYN8_9MAGN